MAYWEMFVDTCQWPRDSKLTLIYFQNKVGHRYISCLFKCTSLMGNTCHSKGIETVFMW